MSFASPNRQRANPALPLAAMLDILFLLLVFFMTVSAFRQPEQQLQVNLPTARTANAAASATPIYLTVSEDGLIYLGQTGHTLDQLRAKLTALARTESFRNEQVVIRGDRDARYGVIIQVTDLARELGFQNVQHATTGAPSAGG